VKAVTAPHMKPVENDSREPQKAGLGQVAKAVFWSFFGIRKRSAHEKDAVTITLKQAVIAGIIGAAILVASLVFLVSLITG
jgi:hypothetical protein